MPDDEHVAANEAEEDIVSGCLGWMLLVVVGLFMWLAMNVEPAEEPSPFDEPTYTPELTPEEERAAWDAVDAADEVLDRTDGPWNKGRDE